MNALTLPPYAAMMQAFHRAHSDVLRAMIAALPLRRGDRVLDMACGDGAYTRWLAERVAPDGHVTGVDLSEAFLERARQRTANSPLAGSISFESGDIARLPYPDRHFDFTWCAQSLYSLPDPRAALSELRRVTRAGGHIAIFENDTLHHVVLPWPPELELVVRQAQLAALDEQSGEADRLFIGRDLCAAFSDVGIADCVVTPYSVARQAPLDADEQTFLRWYFDELRRCARPFLDETAQAEFDRLTRLDSPDAMLNRPDFMVTYLNLVAVGVRPPDEPAGGCDGGGVQ